MISFVLARAQNVVNSAEKDMNRHQDDDVGGGPGPGPEEAALTFATDPETDIDAFADTSYIQIPIPDERDHLESFPDPRHPRESAMKAECPVEISSPVGALKRLLGPPKSPSVNKK
jgi:hypothetical protein